MGFTSGTPVGGIIVILTRLIEPSKLAIPPEELLKSKRAVPDADGSFSWEKQDLVEALRNEIGSKKYSDQKLSDNVTELRR